MPQQAAFDRLLRSAALQALDTTAGLCTHNPGHILAGSLCLHLYVLSLTPFILLGS